MNAVSLYNNRHQSPRVAGNAVYMARVMLSIDTVDTETYSAKSMNASTNLGNVLY
jgi:hypothetical protein